MMPQILLYAVAGTGAAVMNARGRFVLPAAAPALENLGVIAVLATLAFAYDDATLLTIDTPQILLLGAGTTAAVALHAGVQWWGARRLGISLVPRMGWRDPEVREVLHRGVPSLGYATLESVRNFAILPVANRVPGGVVAFQLAYNFYQLPIALAVKPIAVALLPRLSRLYHERALRLFRDEFVRGISFAFFLTIPAVIAYIALSVPLARAVSFGEMATATAVMLVAASLAALAPGVLGETSYLISTHASYALHDARLPFRSMVVRTSVTLVGTFVAFVLTPGTTVLVALGLAIAAGNVAGAWHLATNLMRRLPSGEARLGPSLTRAFAAGLVMAVPAYVIATRLPSLMGGRMSDVVATLAAVLVGLLAFVGLQLLWRSPELDSLVGALRGFLPRFIHHSVRPEPRSR
jgi:putative peptidoglycan lipid II flippase